MTGSRKLSHAVRIWKIREYKGRRQTTYSVRWVVAGEEQHETFATWPLADGYRAKLLSFQQQGVPFDRVTGLPEPMLRERRRRSWYALASEYVDMKWPDAAPKSRSSIADTLATITPALLTTDRGRPSPEVLRRALYTWAFVSPKRKAGPADQELAAAISWIERNTVQVVDLEDPNEGAQLVRGALNLLARRIDGKRAKPNTIARKRAVFYNVLQYAIEEGLLTANPIDRLSWKTPKAVETVDKRVVVNRDQALALLAAVRSQGDIGQRLEAFFGCLYYAGLRPEEALELRKDNLASLPAEGWGELLLTTAAPRSGTSWTDNGRSSQRRGLKHRAEEDTRTVPMHPELVRLVQAHLDRFGTGSDGRLFVGPRGGAIGDSRYSKVWQAARKAALTPAEARSPLARRPYDLRHAALSTWLNAGVPATQVAEWAGNSVEVLLRVYAKCIVGQDEVAKRRIEEAMRDQDPGQDPEGPGKNFSGDSP